MSPSEDWERRLATVEQNVGRLAKLEADVHSLVEFRKKVQRAIVWIVGVILTPILLGVGALVWDSLSPKNKTAALMKQIEKLEKRLDEQNSEQK